MTPVEVLPPVQHAADLTAVPVSPVPADSHSVEDLTAAAASGLRWVALARVGTEALLMVAMVVLARLVSPAQFGAFSIALIVSQLAITVPAEGIGSALVQRGQATADHLRAAAFLSWAIALVGGGLTFLLSYVVVAPVVGTGAAELVRLMSALFLIQAVANVPVAQLRRRLDFRRLSIIELSGSVTRAVVSLALAVLAGLGGYALVIGVLAGAGVSTVIAVVSAPSPLPRITLRPMRDLSSYGLPASAAAVAWTGFANGDYAVLAARLGTVAAGMYWRAYTLGVDYQSKAGVVMNTLAFPLLSRARGDADFEALRRRMVRLITVAIFPFLTVLAVTAPIVIPTVFGGEWDPAITPTQFLCVGGAATLVINAVGAATMAAGRARALLGFGIAHFVVYVGSVIVISPLGISAVALDAAVIHGLFVPVAYRMILNQAGESTLVTLWRDLAPALTASLAMAAVTLSIDALISATGAGPLIRFVAIAGVGSAVYLATLRRAAPSSWRDLMALIGRLTGDRLRFGRDHASDVDATAVSLKRQGSA